MSPARALAAVWLLLCLAIATGCERPVPASYRDYVGHWRGDGMLLVISGHGHGDYERVQDRVRTSIEGPVHGFDGRGFRIGMGPLSAGFVVQRPPHLGGDGRWRMTVDGVELVRVDILPAEPGGNALSL